MPTLRDLCQFCFTIIKSVKYSVWIVISPYSPFGPNSVQGPSISLAISMFSKNIESNNEVNIA